VCSNFARFKPIDNSMWEYCKRRCTSHASLIWSYQRRHWQMAAAIQLNPLCSQSLFQFVRISDAYFAHLLFKYLPPAVIHGIQIWQIWGHSWGGINSRVSSCNNSMMARVLWAFQVSQDAQLSQRDRAALVFAKSRRLELEDNILRTL